VPESLLTILKFFFLALLWLFFLRVLWAVWSELGVAGPGSAPAPVPPSPPPAPSRSAPTAVRLKVVEPAPERGTTYQLGDELTVGRANTCQLPLPDDSYASQLHARFFRQDGRLWLEDLGSTNGTYVNTKPVTAPVALRRGDRVQIGRTVFEITR
jgi:pSer/pThr/pTyr-binding forkhead associated (FHA) protein